MKLNDIILNHEPRPDGILRVRRAIWANPDCYVELDIGYGTTRTLRAPWARLFDVRTQEAYGFPSPQVFLFASDDADDWSLYEKKEEEN